MDRFQDFLREGWVPARKGHPLPRLSAGAMYRFHFQIWRMSPAALELSASLEGPR